MHLCAPLGWKTKISIREVFTLIVFLSMVIIYCLAPEMACKPCEASLGSADKTVDLPSLCPQGNELDKKWRRVNSIVTDYDTRLNESLHQVISAGYGTKDPEVISLLRNFLDPPSQHIIKRSARIKETPQSREILQILNGKVNSSQLRKDNVTTTTTTTTTTTIIIIIITTTTSTSIAVLNS